MRVKLDISYYCDLQHFIATDVLFLVLRKVHGTHNDSPNHWWTSGTDKWNDI